VGDPAGSLEVRGGSHARTRPGCGRDVSRRVRSPAAARGARSARGGGAPPRDDRRAAWPARPAAAAPRHARRSRPLRPL